MRLQQLDDFKSAIADRYVIEREIGRGGMATVYLARDLKNDRRVAIKLLRQELIGVVGPERFQREVAIVAKLNHTNIVPLHEAGEAGGFLYYVMPYVEGESLRQRLEREGPLPIEEALSITHEIADALAYAHERGIVHRDIKPANILLAAGHAVVSDFGIARAIAGTGEKRLTETGLAIGTPGYMSPEQALGESRIDARSDLYSLACLLYEMLAGEPPYSGPSAQAIIAKQLSVPPPSLRTLRDEVPPALDRSVRRALAKVPADRYTEVADFAAALRRAATAEVDVVTFLRGFGPHVKLSAFIVTLIIAVLIVTGWPFGGSDGDRQLDSSRYVVLPFEHGIGVDSESPFNEVQRLHDALSRWSGLSVVDPLRVRETLAGAGALTHSRALEVSRRLGAGRYIRGSVSASGDSLRVYAGIYDATAGGALLADHTIHLSPDPSEARAAFSALTDRLLFQDVLPRGEAALVGTRSLPARKAFLRAKEQIRAWDLDGADSTLVEAIRHDSDYAQAHLWLALARAWSGAGRARWRVATEHATLGRDRLSSAERVMADAVNLQARGELGRACPLWKRLTESTPDEFTAWYGLAHCLTSDNVVLRDPGSPSGWSFRTSYHTALVAYERAFELQPAILRSFHRGSYESLRRLFKAAGNDRRRGRAVGPGTTRFAATPAWQGDTLAFVPYPIRAHTMQLTTAPAAHDEAVQRLREKLRDVAVAWVTATPQSASAMEALAFSLAMLGDPAALDTMHRARALAAGSAEALMVAGSQVWMELAFALGSDLSRLDHVKQLADSILDGRLSGATADPMLLAGLAVLTGRVRRAASYARDPAVANAMGAPPPLAEAAPALLIFASLGGPRDTLAALERRVKAAIDEQLLPAQRPIARYNWLMRPATLAFPDYAFATVSNLAGQDWLLDLQAAWVAGQRDSVRRGLDRIQAARGESRPANLTTDGLYPEAALLVELGDRKAAAELMDATVRGLPQVAPQVLADPVRVAALVRALALRARIADELGEDEKARRWAQAVLTLWSDADAFLQQTVAGLRSLKQ